MPRSTGQTRKLVNLSKPLHHDLTVYALAAGAAGVGMLALAPPADAEVVYTQVNQTIDRHQGYAIDLNHDGIVDFRIQNIFRVITEGGYPYIKAFVLQVRPAEGVQVGRYAHGEAALLRGDKIGPIQPAAQDAVMASQLGTSGFGTYYFGSWLNVANRYLGIAFNIDGEVHYGWARLTVHWNHDWTLSADITGYAYETIPNKPIAAGDTGSGNAVGVDSGPLGEMFSPPQPDTKPATLGALALGARGLTIWRRPE
jgi:hypothetical protein